MMWFSLFFFLSGLCSIVYELVWLRLTTAKFGVTTALVSIVLSAFMAGLGAGSWLAGVALRRYEHRLRFSPLRLYGVIELLIGASALVVPLELVWGNRLLATGELQLGPMLPGETTPQELIALSPDTPALDDDRPINEYDRLRSMFAKNVEGAAPER